LFTEPSCRLKDRGQAAERFQMGGPTDAFTQPPPDVIDPDDTETND
jgi:hypothetical protein